MSRRRLGLIDLQVGGRVGGIGLPRWGGLGVAQRCADHGGRLAGMTDRFAIEEHKKLFNLELWN